MSGTVNEVTLVGFIGKDPEIKHTAAGQQIVNFSMATKEGSKEKERTSWHRLIAFGKVAELVGKYVKKGSFLYVKGVIQYREWEKDGVKQYVTEIVVDRINFIPREKAAPAPAAAPAAPAPYPSGNPFGGDDDSALPF